MSTIDNSLARELLGMGGTTVRKASSPATFAQLQARRELERVTKVATFDDLTTIKELRSWLPSATDTLAQVLGAALLVEAEEFTPKQRVTAAREAVDSFRDELLERVATGIGKRHGAKRSARKEPVTKADTNWWRGIL